MNSSDRNNIFKACGLIFLCSVIKSIIFSVCENDYICVFVKAPKNPEFFSPAAPSLTPWEDESECMLTLILRKRHLGWSLTLLSYLIQFSPLFHFLMCFFLYCPLPVIFLYLFHTLWPCRIMFKILVILQNVYHLRVTYVVP